jgi:hypothetical protein
LEVRKDMAFQKWQGAVAVVLLLTQAAYGQSKTELASTTIQAAFQYMANAYLCRDALGGLAHYQAARTIAVETAVLIGMGRDQAVLAVDEMDQRFTTDPRTKNPGLDAVACQTAVNESLNTLSVAQARYRSAN